MNYKIKKPYKGFSLAFRPTFPELQCKLARTVTILALFATTVCSSLSIHTTGKFPIAPRQLGSLSNINSSITGFILDIENVLYFPTEKLDCICFGRTWSFPADGILSNTLPHIMFHCRKPSQHTTLIYILSFQTVINTHTNALRDLLFIRRRSRTKNCTNPPLEQTL